MVCRCCLSHKILWFVSSRPHIHCFETGIESPSSLPNGAVNPRERENIMSWNEQKIQMLKDMWGNGYSASEIAKRLGGMTRNAVIGKAHRLKLSSRPSPIRREDEGGIAALGGTASCRRSNPRRKRVMLRPLPSVPLPSTQSRGSPTGKRRSVRSNLSSGSRDRCHQSRRSPLPLAGR